MLAQNDVTVKRYYPNVPMVGQRIEIDLTRIRQDSDGEKLGTPMTKIQYSAKDQTWRQAGRKEAGMYVFFQNDPEYNHTACIIRRVIPQGTACYADLVP